MNSRLTLEPSQETAAFTAECFKTRFILQAIEKFVKQLEVIHFRQRIVQHTKSSCFTIIKKIYGSYIKVFCRIDFLTIMTIFLISSFCRFNYRKVFLKLPCQNSLWEKPEYPTKTDNFQEHSLFLHS